jgi:hypothetical protein
MSADSHGAMSAGHRRLHRARTIALLLASLLPACGGGSPPSGPTPTATPPPAFQTQQSANFTFRYTAIDASTVAQTAARVEAEHARVTRDLGVTGMGRVTITLYPDQAALRAGVAPFVGVIPSFATGLVTGPYDVHIVSPNAQPGSYDTVIVHIVHEFAHGVSLVANPGFANNPRWLWEAVALYEARQFVDPRGLGYLTSLQPPTLAQLSDISDVRIYDVGALIGEFVVETWGQEALVRLVRTNGDLAAVLGIDDATFVSRWMAYVRSRYGF